MALCKGLKFPFCKSQNMAHINMPEKMTRCSRSGFANTLRCENIHMPIKTCLLIKTKGMEFRRKIDKFLQCGYERMLKRCCYKEIEVLRKFK